jgi:hypothetical protein
MDRPCEGAWWGQRKALELLQKTVKTKIDMKAATLTLDEILKGSRGKNKKRPLKGYYCQDDDTSTYYLYDSSKDKFYSTIRDPQGRLHKQEEANSEGRPIPTAQWGNGHTHVQYSRPTEYTLGDIGSPLDRISFKQLTLEFSKNRCSPPSGAKEWDKRIAALQKATPDWNIIADRYATRFLTPRDAATHFKHITHKALFTTRN